MDPVSIAKIQELLQRGLVSIWLSPEGVTAVKQIIDKASFRARVELVDALGLWLRLPPKPGSGMAQADSLLLLKWNYLASIQVPAAPGEVQQLVQPELIH